MTVSQTSADPIDVVSTADTQSLAADSAAPVEGDISVAIAYPGNRVAKLAIPLLTTDMDVTVKPRNPYDADIVVLDNADRSMLFPILKKPITSSKIVYRMRGDVFRELETWDMPGWKKKIATDGLLPRLDGAVAVNRPLAEKIHRRAGVDPTGVAGLAVDPDEWPQQDHTDDEIRALTLTNCNYRRKIQPILEWAPVVDRFLAANGGGEWIIGGDGLFEFLLVSGLKPFEHVHFAGYLDAEAAVGRANLMLHPSNLDGLPNGMLEGMAGRLPVITNDFEAFTSYDGPIGTAASDHELRALLDAALDPDWRSELGQRTLDYVLDHHSAEMVGREYVRYFQRLLREDDGD